MTWLCEFLVVLDNIKKKVKYYHEIVTWIRMAWDDILDKLPQFDYFSGELHCYLWAFQ